MRVRHAVGKCQQNSLDLRLAKQACWSTSGAACVAERSGCLHVQISGFCTLNHRAGKEEAVAMRRREASWLGRTAGKFLLGGASAWLTGRCTPERLKGLIRAE